MFEMYGDVMTGENGTTDPPSGRTDVIDTSVETDEVIWFIIREDENIFGKGIIVVGRRGNKKGNIGEDKNELCPGVCPVGVIHGVLFRHGVGNVRGL